MAQSQHNAQRSVRRIILLATALGLAMIALIWVAVESDDRQERDFAHRAAVQAGQNYARLFEEHIRQAINETDNTIKFIRQDYLRSPVTFDLSSWVKNDYSFKNLALQFTIIGPDGIMESTTTANATPRVDLSDRRHFRVHVGATEDTLFISEPVLGRASGRWSIQLTRRITDETGRFRGVIVASLDPHFLSRFYESIDVGKGGRISMIGSDGVVRATAGANAQAIGSRFADETMLRRAFDSRLVVQHDPRQVGQVTVYRADNNWPLMVMVHVDDTEARAQRQAASRGMRLSAGIFTVGVLAVVMLGGAYWRRFSGALAELTRSRAAARAASTELDLTLNNMAQGILMVDAQGQVAVINQTALILLGLPSTFTRRGFSLADLLAHQDMAGDCVVVDAHGGADPDPDQISVREHRRRDGMILEVCTRPLPGGGFVQTYTDVTERKRGEQALRDARDEAQKASQARTAFLATMSHEIRTPLNGIIGMSSIMETTELSDTQRAHLRTIHECGEALLALVNDVLDYSKLDSGAVALEQTPVDVGGLVGAVKEMLGPRALEKNLSFDVVVSDDVPAHIEADGTRIKQVLINLVGNALKFTLSGGIVVSAAARRLADGQPGLRFSVVDSGIGISAESHGRLFKEFSQVDASITRRFGGTGLGLAICKRLVEAMGGEIGVESQLGKGSIFWFDIPARSVAASPTAPERAPRSQLPARLRVLVVEDNPVNQQVATLLLSAMGHAVSVVEHGGIAVELARHEPFDVIFMDMQMPVMDGTQATRALRAGDGPNRQTAIVGLTANAFASDRQACLDAGMDEFLPKPVTREKLERILAELARPEPSPSAGEGVDVDHSLRGALFDAIGPDAARALVTTFVDEARRLGDAIAAAAEAGDREDLRALLHQLKGAAANLGHSGMAAMASRDPSDLQTPAQRAAFAARLEAMLAVEEADLAAAA